MILPKHILQSYNGAGSGPSRELPGTGPYSVVSFEDEDQLIIGNDVVPTIKIVYEPNPFFREADKPFFRRVEVQGGADASVAARAVLMRTLLPGRRACGRPGGVLPPRRAQA